MVDIADMELEISLLEKTPWFDFMTRNWPNSETVAHFCKRAGIQDADAAVKQVGGTVVNPERFREHVTRQVLDQVTQQPIALAVESSWNPDRQADASGPYGIPQRLPQFDPYEDYDPERPPVHDTEARMEEPPTVTTGPIDALSPEALDKEVAAEEAKGETTLVFNKLEDEPYGA
jgi:hypothetical protein